MEDNKIIGMGRCLKCGKEIRMLSGGDDHLCSGESSWYNYEEVQARRKFEKEQVKKLREYLKYGKQE